MSSAFTIDEAARRIGTYQWLEMRLFEVLGGWVEVVPELEAKMMLARHCYHHAWHAQLWHKVLPRLPDDVGERPRVATNQYMEALVRALRDQRRPDSTIERLVGVYRVLLPNAIATYRAHLSSASEVTDGPTNRCLGLALADERADMREGEALLESLIATESLTGSLTETAPRRRQASDHQRMLEAILGPGVGAG